MTTLFYVLDDSPARLAHPTPLPEGAEFRIWRPDRDGLPPRPRRSLHNLLWWGFSRLGLFARNDFAEITVWREGRLVHRLIVTPRWRRFPFMDCDDLQLGDIWTHPDSRGRGIARAAIAAAHREFSGRAHRFWYLVGADNTPSIRLIEGCGYRLAGRGRRTSPFGIRIAGCFLLESSTV